MGAPFLIAVRHRPGGCHWPTRAIVVKIIPCVFEEEQHGKERADYGSYLIAGLSQRLEPEYGSGFTKRQLERARQFYRTYPNASALRPQFNWTQYRTLIQISEVLWRSCDFVRGNFSNNPGWEALFGEVRGHKVTTSQTRMATRPRKSAKIVDEPRQTGSYGMSLMRALQPSSGKRVWLARRNM